MADNYDLDSNMKYLLNKTIDNNINGGIKLQDKILDSKNFNETFKYIEEALNFLYEKNRILQDVITYSKAYLQNEIINDIAECRKKIQAIEKDRDLIKNNTYIKIPIPFDFSLKTISDRNGKIISNADVYNNRLIMSDKNYIDYNVSEVNVKNSSGCIYTNSHLYIKRKNYRSLYASSNILSSPVEECITIQFSSSVKINRLRVNTSNCTIKSVTLSNLNKDIEELPVEKMEKFNDRIVDEINIIIQSSNYIKSHIKYDEVNGTDINSIINSINTDSSDDSSTVCYYYLFGIDDIKASYCTLNECCSFCSKDINIGKLQSNEHLSLYAEDTEENGSIEYSIISGNKEIPILPENISEIHDERIFYKMPTRFQVDTNKPVIIKKDNEVINMNLLNAININDGSIYTVSYTPIINVLSDDINETIKIKAIMRTYDTNLNTYINSIKIKKYGGNNLWEE